MSTKYILWQEPFDWTLGQHIRLAVDELPFSWQQSFDLMEFNIIYFLLFFLFLLLRILKSIAGFVHRSKGRKDDSF